MVQHSPFSWTSRWRLICHPVPTELRAVLFFEQIIINGVLQYGILLSLVPRHSCYFFSPERVQVALVMDILDWRVLIWEFYFLLTLFFHCFQHPKTWLQVLPALYGSTVIDWEHCYNCYYITEDFIFQFDTPSPWHHLIIIEYGHYISWERHRRCSAELG